MDDCQETRTDDDEMNVTVMFSGDTGKEPARGRGVQVSLHVIGKHAEREGAPRGSRQSTTSDSITPRPDWITTAPGHLFTSPCPTHSHRWMHRPFPPPRHSPAIPMLTARRRTASSIFVGDSLRPWVLQRFVPRSGLGRQQEQQQQQQREQQQQQRARPPFFCFLACSRTDGHPFGVRCQGAPTELLIVPWIRSHIHTLHWGWTGLYMSKSLTHWGWAQWTLHWGG